MDGILRAGGSEARRAAVMADRPTGAAMYGTLAAAWQAADVRLRDALRGAPPETVRDTALALARTRAHEPTHLAYALLDRRRDARDLLTPADLAVLGHALDNWATVDTHCVVVVGPLWRLGRVSDAFVRRWSRSPDRWLRRAALVATIGLNQKSRGGTGDVPRTLALCEALLDDRDDMVVKAQSWALRELSKRDAEAVRAFVARHGDRVAARVRREVACKLATGRKTPPRR